MPGNLQLLTRLSVTGLSRFVFVSEMRQRNRGKRTRHCRGPWDLFDKPGPAGNIRNHGIFRSSAIATARGSRHEVRKRTPLKKNPNESSFASHFSGIDDDNDDDTSLPPTSRRVSPSSSLSGRKIPYEEDPLDEVEEEDVVPTSGRPRGGVGQCRRVLEEDDEDEEDDVVLADVGLHKENKDGNGTNSDGLESDYGVGGPDDEKEDDGLVSFLVGSPCLDSTCSKRSGRDGLCC